MKASIVVEVEPVRAKIISTFGTMAEATSAADRAASTIVFQWYWLGTCEYGGVVCIGR